jgi:hypothetical protein
MSISTGIYDERSRSRLRRYGGRIALLLFGGVGALFCAEALLRAIDQPHFYERLPQRPRFDVADRLIDGRTFYVNLRSARERFVYDGDPRGYFGPDHAVEYRTNGLGFRGPEFRPAKAADTFRIMFLGDSFTFGEGVHFEDTYPEIAGALLQREFGDDRRIEALNFGVGGYNTTQSLQLMRMNLERFAPDVVVLGYVLNDAEPPLIAYEPATDSIARRPREQTVPEGIADPLPPDSLLYRFRSAQLVWQVFSNRRTSRATLAHYRSIYEPTSTGWLESRRALHEIGELCRVHEIPFVVVLFPILVELSEDYPFAEIHERVARAVADSGGIAVDLFPSLRGMRARELWVHPTDQHPNERVHAIAARRLAETILRIPASIRTAADRSLSK